MAGLAAVGSAVPAAFAGTGSSAASKAVGERLVPPGKLGIQHFSVRDAITRRSIANSVANGLTPTRGYLGGPNFPADPTDLGPLVDLPGWFAETFEFLARLGYRGFEFFQFTQNAAELGRQPTFAEIRSYLDNAGLASFGTHTGGLGNALTGVGTGMYSPTTGGLSTVGQTPLDIAATLGHTMIGTAGDPTGLDTLANSATQAGWTEMAHRANVVGQALPDNGIRWHWHTEQNGWRFFTTAGLEDALGFWTTNSHRLVGWHVKDGSRIVPATGPGVNPFTQTVARTPTFTDVIYAGEKGSRLFIVESDSAIGNAPDPGRSLRHAKISIANMLGLRGGYQGNGRSSVADDPELESVGQAAG